MLIDHRQQASPAFGFFDDGAMARPDDLAVGVVASSSSAQTYFTDILAAYAIYGVSGVELSGDDIEPWAFGCVLMMLDDGPWREAVIGRCAALKARQGCKVICVYETDLDDAVRRTSDLDVFIFLKADAPPSVIASSVVLANYVTAFVQATGIAVMSTPDTGRSSSGQARMTLTARQTEVLHLLEKGYSNKAMARSLQLSEPTVKLHLTSLRRLFNASNRTEVLSKAMKLGLLPF